MRLTTKARYGVRAMLELAANYRKRALLLRQLAKRQQISQKYLERILSTLKANGFIKSTRGPHGGYTLSKPPSQIKLSEIVQCLEGSLAPVECVDDAKICQRSDFCPVRGTWLVLKQSIIKTLDAVNLEDLVRLQNKMDKKGPTMYNI